MPAPMIRTSRCSRSWPVPLVAVASAISTTGILAGALGAREIRGALADRAAAAQHFATHPGAVREGEVAPGEEPPGRAGRKEEVLFLALEAPAPFDFEFR